MVKSYNLLNQYSPVPRARSFIAGKDATRAQIYAGLGILQRVSNKIKSGEYRQLAMFMTQLASIIWHHLPILKVVT